MELAFWDPSAVGDFAPDITNLQDNGPKGTTNDVMQTMGSLAFDEMLQWMEQDLGNSDQLLTPELAEPVRGAAEAETSTAPGSSFMPAVSADFQSFLDGLTGPIGGQVDPFANTAELAALGGGNPPPSRVPIGSELPGPSTSSMPPSLMSLVPPTQQALPNFGLPFQSSPMFGNMQPQPAQQMLQGQPQGQLQTPHPQTPALQPTPQEFMGALTSMMQAAMNTGGGNMGGNLPPTVSPFHQAQMGNGNGMQPNNMHRPMMSPFQQQQPPLGLGMMGPGHQLQQHASTSLSDDLLSNAAGVSPVGDTSTTKHQGDMLDLVKLEQQVTAELSGAKDPTRDILTQTLLEHSVDGIHNVQDSLYAQNMSRQLNRSRVQVAPKDKGGRAKNKLNDLEKRVAELQMQKSQLTEETTNLQCRLNILDRMLQLRREGADEVLEQNVRLDEQIQVAALAADTREAAKNPLAQPPVMRTIPKILMQDYSIPTFEEMSAYFKLSVERVSKILTEMDRLPRGTIVLETPLAATLQKELQAAQSFLTGYQARGGGYLIQSWQLKVYEQMLAIKPTEPAEFDKRYKQVYPLLQLSQQQKERIKLSYDIYVKRMRVIGEEEKKQEEKTREMLVNVNHLSMTERCREMMRAHQSLWRLRCIHENLKEGHAMFVSIVMRKILDTMQLARLIITSYPFLPCTMKLAETVDADLRATTGVASTELAAQEMMAIVKPYASKFAREL